MTHRLHSLRARRLKGPGSPLNITPFLNLMVVLIPFILTGVVFSKMTVLDLNLPSSQGVINPSDQEPLQLIVTLHEDGIIVTGNRLPVTRLPQVSGHYDLKGLSTLLQAVKSQYPKEKSVILLSEPQIPYESLVAVMDTCRNNGSSELYPDVTLGEVKKT